MADRWKLQKSHLANRAGLPTARVSDYIHGRALPDDKEQAIEQAIIDSSRIQAAFFPIRLALDKPDNVEMALFFVTATYGHASPEQIMQLKTAAETAEFTRQASQGLEESCSLTEQKEL
jgi:hypothetical protein